jgi:hypothetical protein
VAKETDTDHYIAFQGETLLLLNEFILEAGAATEGDDLIFTYHVM